MNLKLSTLRRNLLMPLVSLVVSLLLVGGQIFNCCQFNESLSEQFVKAAESVGLWKFRMAPMHSPKLAEAHGECHVHAPTDAALFTRKTDTPYGASFRLHENCLTEVDFVPEAIKPDSEGAPIQFFPRALVALQVPARPMPTVERLLAPNRSSPPLFLLTRQILV